MNVFLRTVACMTLSITGATAQTTIDFADSTGTNGEFTSRGYDFTTSWPYILSINPFYQFWAQSGVYAFNMHETNDELFTLNQLRVQFTGSAPVFAAAGVVFKGNLQGGGVIFHPVSMLTYVDLGDGVNIAGDETVVFDSAWTNLTSVDVYMTVHTNSLTGLSFDDIVVDTAGVIPADIDVDTTPLPVHPDHDGSASSPNGLNDIIKVVVLGASTGAGDPVNLDTGNINPASLRFGPAAATVDPGSTPEFNIDYDSDGIFDARFQGAAA